MGEMDDQDRMQWMEDHPEFHLHSRIRGRGSLRRVQWACYPGLAEHNLYETAREAVDAAMTGGWDD